MSDVVVGIDESLAAAHALDWAMSEATSAARRLRVIHVWSPAVWSGMPGLGYSVPPVDLDVERLATTFLEEQVAKAVAARPSGAVPSLLQEPVRGDAGRVLTEAGRAADLVVVGGRGYGPIKGAFLGSATNYVLHHAHCPVMVVPESATPPDRVRRVVVGVDGSPSSRAALQWGFEAARRHGCPMVAFHACVPVPPPGRGALAGVQDIPALLADARRGVEDELACALKEPDGVEISVEARHGNPAWELLDHTGSEDLLVLGSRGRGGFASLVLGSVATQVTHHARGPVVVVRDAKEPASG
jgi:nucleotide-binding universal stress UspA family protein